MEYPLYRLIARVIDALHNCQKSGNVEWEQKHRETIRKLEDHLPHGPGFDSRTKIAEDESTNGRIVLYTSYHHMDDVGGYDGWTVHRITVYPSLSLRYDLRIAGKNRNDIKEYISMAMTDCLDQSIDPSSL